MQTSPTTSELSKALSAAQGEIDDPSKDRENPHFRSSYATLAAVLAVVRPAFARHGLSVVQGASTTPEGVCVSTRILHQSGEWIEETLSAPPAKRDPQGIGSAVTYLRRYGLMSMAGVAAAEDDDDGEAAQGRGNGGGKGGGQQQRRQDDRRQDDAPREERRQEPKREEPKREERPAQTSDKPAMTPEQQLAWLLGELLKLDAKFTAMHIAKEWRLNPPQLTPEHVGRLKAYYLAEKATRKAAESSKEAP